VIASDEAMIDKPKILVTAPIHEQVRSRLEAIGELEMNTATEPWCRDELLRRAADATAMMGFMPDKVDKDFLRAAPRLRLVACALKGYDNYDIDACKEAGVCVSIVPDLLTAPTAELAIGLAIGLGRHLLHADQYVRSGAFAGWRPHFYGAGLHGSVAAILGVGEVGAAIAERLRGFGCANIYGVDPVGRSAGTVPATLDEAMSKADFMFAAAPLTAATRHLIGRRQISLAKSGQLLINVGRGSVIDEAAVATALAQGRLGGYAADVFECEDWGLPDRPPTISPALLSHPRTLFTPHLGSAVSSVRLAIEQRAADNILAYFQGDPPPDAIN
jgi:phosphonate dehydrogenase